MSKINMILIIIIISVLVIFLTPVLLEYFIFRNNIYSVLSNSEWGSFLGSYIGGLFGGIGTLIAVCITTKETRKIQKENSEQIKNEREINDRKERKQFSDSVAEDIAKYIANIQNYSIFTCNSSELYKSKIITEKRLRDIRKSLYEEKERFRNIDINTKFNEYQETEKYIDELKEKKEDFRYIIQDITNELELNKVDRINIDKYYSILKMKLKNIELANSIIKKLEEIHRESYGINRDNDIDTNKDIAATIIKETEVLLDITIEFIDKYVDNN